MEDFFGLSDKLDTSFILILLTTFFTILYYYSTWQFDYWKKQGIPGDRPWPIVGTLYPPLFKTIEFSDCERHKRYGRIAGGFEGPHRVLYITDPEMIKQVMAQDFSVFTNRRHLKGFDFDKVLGEALPMLHGEKWKTTRTLLRPTFTSGKIKLLVQFAKECMKNFMKSLENDAKSQTPLNMQNCFSAFTLDVIANFGFGVSTNSLDNPNDKFLLEARKVFQPPVLVMYFFYVFPKLTGTLLGLGALLPFLPEPFKYLKDVAGTIIDFRMNNKNTNVKKDFLDLLLEAQELEESENPTSKKKILTRTSMIAQCMIFLLAGFEPSSIGMAVFAYCLAINPDVQEKLLEEIDKALAESKGEITYDTVMGLQYLDMTLSETLRLYSPATRVDRECSVDNYNLNGITLNKGDIVLVSIHAMHKDDEFYPNSEVFDPERFSPENKANRNPYTYLPFGLGPRNCIGGRMALAEIKFAMTCLLSKFRFTTCEETDIPLNYNVGMLGGIRPKKIMLKIQKRIDGPLFET